MIVSLACLPAGANRKNCRAKRKRSKNRNKARACCVALEKSISPSRHIVYRPQRDFHVSEAKPHSPILRTKKSERFIPGIPSAVCYVRVSLVSASLRNSSLPCLTQQQHPSKIHAGLSHACIWGAKLQKTKILLYDKLNNLLNKSNDSAVKSYRTTFLLFGFALEVRALVRALATALCVLI